MPRSMTGFGRAQFTDESLKVTVEIKSVNHRFLEAVVKLPRKYSLLEERVKDAIRDRLQRGRIDVWIGIEEVARKTGGLQVDKDLAMDYYKSLKDLAELVGISPEITVYELSCMEGVVSLREQEADMEELWGKILPVFKEAMEQLIDMRCQEGEKLKQDIQNRITVLTHLVSEIEERTPIVVQAYKDKLNDKIAALSEGVDLDPNRLVTEVAIFAEKSDITEEVVRFRSHLDQLSRSLALNEPIGRKLDFLMQELNREMNTMGSKSPDLILSQKVVDGKAEIEKMREQIQNLE